MKEPVKKDEIARFDELYHILLRLNLNSEASYPKELAELTQLDISVINILSTKPDVIVREIAENLKIPNSTLTSSLNRLEKKDVANRIISSRDRRSFGLELTEKGKKIQQIHIQFELAYFESILSKLDTHEERELLLDLFKKIVIACQNEANEIKE